MPYSAVVPLLLMGFKWVCAKLHTYGLLPGFIAEMLKLPKSPPSSSSSSSSTTTTTTTTTGEAPTTAPEGTKGVVEALASEERFGDLVKTNEAFVVKFTAAWCKPCHRIQPYYERKAAEHTNRAFLTVDVDDFDDIAGKYGVAMMPTFLVVRGDSVLGTYRGSSEPELETFLNEHL